MATRTVLGGIRASWWGLVAFWAAVISAIGYVVQTILDFVSEPAVVGEVEFWGLFYGSAAVALVAGIVAAVTGRKRGDSTLHLGLVAIAYVVLVQTIQMVWD